MTAAYKKIYICDRLGWPVAKKKNGPITNLIRFVLHGRKLRRYWNNGCGGITFDTHPDDVQPIPDCYAQRKGTT